MNEPTVSASDIARLAGVGRAAVSNWRRRYEDFPAPVDGTSSNPRFPLTQVERWLAEQGKLQPGAEWERLWGLVEAYRGEHEPADLLARIGEFLVHLHRRGADTPLVMGLEPSPVVLDPALAREISDLAAVHGPRATFEGLWERFARANSRWMSVTAPELAMLMAELAGPAGVVLDPAAGAGTLLGPWTGRARVLGQEIDPGMARIGAARLALADADAEVRAGDSLLADAYRDRLVDAVLCDPPFNERHWGHEDLMNDPRWQYGIPPRMESELAWVQHCVAHLKPGGTAVVTMPPSAASRRSGRRIRAELVRSGVLRAVVALPPIGSVSPVHLWVLRRDDTKPELLVVNVSDHVRVSGPDWRAVRDVTVGAWRQFGVGPVTERPGVVRVVAVLDLLREEVDLTPARNLPVHAGPRTMEHLLAQRAELAAGLDQLPALLPAADWVPADGDLRLVSTIAELMSTGALNLLQANAPDSLEAGDAPLMHLRDLMVEGRPTGRVTREATQRYVTTQPGDVVVPSTGTQLVARVVTQGGIVLGRGLGLLRPNREALDPWFLAGFLNSTANTRQAASHLSTGSRLDVRRCEIPRMTLAQQRPYAAMYRRAGAFTDALANVTRLARGVVQGMTDGMAESVIAPRPPRGDR